ncbi:C-terminal binding protein [Alteribacter populi]|uniref:C-terminal binding protein n=1 Tax=Alteribacter populi TaxID=2011011 RepID=UPI000BBA42AA|nr:C-terminal binding protein [Alteribacter populi]
MAKFKVVVTDFEYSTFEPEKEVFADLDVELVFEQCRTEDEVIEKCKNADALLNQYAPLGKKVIDSLDQCKVISRYGVGVNNVDLEAANEKGIIVSNVTDYCLDEVADHAMTMLLASARKIALLNEAVKRGKWDFKAADPIFRLRGTTLGLIGFGNIPQNLTKKAQAFGIKVVAYDPFVPQEVADSHQVELLDLNEVCNVSDYVSVHLPLNQHTEKIMSDEQFAAMKNTAFVINTARGPVIDEKALIKALEQNEIAGAALDVLEKEPVEKDNPLLKMDQVILSPHAAFYSVEAERELKRKAAENIADTLSGYFPKYIVGEA